MKQIGIDYDDKSIEIGPDDTPDSELYVIFKGKTYKGVEGINEAKRIMKGENVAFAIYEDFR